MRVTVEVVLQVDHDAPPVRDSEVPHSVPYHVKVLVRSGPEYVRNLLQVRLGNNAHRGSANVEEGADLRIVPGKHTMQDEDLIGRFCIRVPFCSHRGGDGTGFGLEARKKTPCFQNVWRLILEFVDCKKVMCFYDN